MVALVARSRGKRWYSEAVRSLLEDSETNDPVQAIRYKAAALVDSCEFDGPPIDCRMVASLRGVVEVKKTAMEQAGMLVPRGGGGYDILLNEADPATRQNFTCDHETCHTLFPYLAKRPVMKVDLRTGTFDTDAEEEYLCDVGAAELRMPMRWFRQSVKDFGPSIDTIPALASVYETSLEAAAVQFVLSQAWPCAVVVWQMAHKPADKPYLAKDQMALDGMESYDPCPPKLRTKFAVVGESMDTFFPRFKSVEPESLIQQCYDNEETTKGTTGLFTGKTVRPFYTESMFVPTLASDSLPGGKVITLIMRNR